MDWCLLHMLSPNSNHNYLLKVGAMFRSDDGVSCHIKPINIGPSPNLFHIPNVSRPESQLISIQPPSQLTI